MDNDSIRVKHYFKIDFRTPIDREHEYVLIKGDRRFIIECSDPEALLALPAGWEDSRVDIQHVKDCQGHICGVISETGISHNASFDSDKFVNPRKRIEDDLETPTPGRIVWVLDRRHLEYPPKPAGVMGDSELVYGAIEVHIWGSSGPGSVRHVKHISEEDPTVDVGWDWMPFQKGQAKKLEQVQAIEWMGLRSMPTDAELENRFTYHAPTPVKIDQYQLIRDEAKRLATLLLNHCPPCPELASAMDHLDTVVFKANAAIARH